MTLPKDLLDIIKIYSSKENVYKKKLVDEYSESVTIFENGTIVIAIPNKGHNTFNFRHLNPYMKIHIYTIGSYGPVGILSKNY